MPIFRVTSQPKRSITLSRFPNHSGTGREFKVIKTINTTTPQVGRFMGQRQVEDLIDRETEVTIILHARK